MRHSFFLLALVANDYVTATFNVRSRIVYLPVVKARALEDEGKELAIDFANLHLDSKMNANTLTAMLQTILGVMRSMKKLQTEIDEKGI